MAEPGRKPTELVLKTWWRLPDGRVDALFDIVDEDGKLVGPVILEDCGKDMGLPPGPAPAASGGCPSPPRS